MIGFKWETAEEMDEALALRLKNIRKRRGLSQQQLSERSGVSYGSLKRFESTGQISLLSLTKLAISFFCQQYNLRDSYRYASKTALTGTT